MVYVCKNKKRNFKTKKTKTENISTRIEIILGPMFSGKSTELIRRTNQFKAINKKILLINHSLDIRTDKFVKTHNNSKEKALKTKSLMHILKSDIFKKADVVGIDEAQFFEDLLLFIKEAEKQNKIYILAGLDGNFKREPMGDLLKIIPYCDEVTKLSAMDMVDKDGTKGIFTKRISGSSTKSVLIGAEESYMAVSRKNFLQ